MLKDKLLEYKKLTMECINLCENEDFDELKNSIDKRYEIIRSINEFSYSKSEFKNICEELRVVELEKKLNILMEERKSKLKNQMSNVTNSKRAHNVYNKSFINTSHFLKKRM